MTCALLMSNFKFGSTIIMLKKDIFYIQSQDANSMVQCGECDGKFNKGLTFFLLSLLQEKIIYLDVISSNSASTGNLSLSLEMKTWNQTTCPLCFTRN